MIDTVAVPYVLYRNRSKIHAQSTRLHTYSFSRHQKGHTGKFFLKNKRRPQSPTLHCALRSGLHSFDCSMFVFFQALWLVFTCVILENQHNNFYLFCLLLLSTAGLPISYNLGRRWDVIITRSDFKSEAIFGFFSPKYTGHVT